jgi:TolB-like protein/tetratricopeptide (TPR) repeat protein
VGDTKVPEAKGDDLADQSNEAVFLSYASEDSAAATQICDALRAAGIPVWFDRSELRGGDSWDQTIRHKIRACRLFVPVISRHTEARSEGYFRREWKLAVDRTEDMAGDRTFIVPVAVDATSSAGARVPHKFQEVHWIRLPEGAATDSFITRVRNLLTQAPPELGHERAGDLHTASRAKYPDRGISTPVQMRWRPLAVSLGTVLLILLFAYVLREHSSASTHVVSGSQASPPARVDLGKSVAVLPFVDMSEKKDQEYFADGMSEEVIDLLAHVPSVRVVARTSSFQFKGKNIDLRSVGDTLGAAYVVEGTVRKSGERLRVTAQLVSTKDGSHLWAESYTESPDDVLGIQDRIAASIVRALQVTIGADELPSRTTLKSPEAYDLYLRGRHAMDRFDKEGFESASGYFQQSLELDPSLIRAAEWLAVADEFLAEWGFVPVREGYERARASVDRALKLNPDSGLARSILCTIEAVYDWNAPAALRECRHALALEPRNPQVLLYAGQMEDIVGNWNEAEHLLNSGVALDPLFAGFHVLIAIADEHTGRLAEAEARRRLTLQISPSYVRGHYGLGTTLLAEGKAEAALQEMQKETPDGGRDAGLAMAFYALGRKAESDAALARLVKERAEDMASWIAEVHAFRGESDQAFAWLDRAYLQRDVNLWWFKAVLAFRNLESDPRYGPFLARMNLSEQR